MEKINVRELVGYSESEIWGIENIGHVIAVFDDGEEVQTNGRYLIYSWYCWIFHSKYPELPMTSRYLLKGQVNKRSHLELKERAMFDLRDICVERGLPIEMEVWSRWVFEAFDELFTASKEKLDRYVGTISALDFVDVLHHPKIYEVNTKLQTMAGEEAIRAVDGHSLIFRTSWVFGARGENFVKTILRLAKENDALNVVDDQIGSPTPAALIATVTGIALAMVRCGQMEKSGKNRNYLYHLAAARPVSWREFARTIVLLAGTVQGFDLRLKPEEICPINTQEYPTPARRPANSRLDCSRLERDFGLQMPDWAPYLARMLQLLALKQNGY